jgi:hypothetical protein
MDDDGLAIIVGILIIVVIAGLLFGLAYWYGVSTQSNITLTVQDKFIDPGKDESHYLIRGTNSNVIIELNRLPLDFSANIDVLYSDIKVNQTYTFECYGWVVPAFYWYPTCYKIV